jgi:two-component system chemotaxis response regulator CheY
MKVLVVDDSSMIRRLIKNSLATAGVQDIIEAANGQEAVDSTKEQQPDLILMDWNMPKVTGLEAVQAIRASGNQVPIVMVTTEAEKSRVVEAIKAGINDYLVKPFTAEQLVQRLNKFVAAK